jgi:hypothetical protein
MNFVTHLKMASLFKSSFRSHPSFRALPFILGNVKPDIRFNGLSSPHMKKYNYIMFMDYVNELPNLMDSPIRFSIRLGEIMHHLCDYFCLAHRDEALFHQLKWHFDYENALEKRFDQLNEPYHALSTSIDIPHYDDIFECINEMSIYYDQFPHSIEKDIAFTFSIVQRASLMLLKQCESVEVFNHEHSTIY